jgi:predicted site-specific integrase-resolvase
MFSNHENIYKEKSQIKCMNGRGRFINNGKASKFTGLDQQTLRILADTKKVRCYKTPAGQRRFDRIGLEEMCNLVHDGQQVGESKIRNFLYAHVSSKKQMDDLSRQIEFLKSRRPEYSSYDVVSDVASGINFTSKGVSSILDACIQGIVGEVVVSHRDRMCRFGFDIVNQMVSKAGGKITVIDDQRDKSTEQ